MLHRNEPEPSFLTANPSALVFAACLAAVPVWIKLAVITMAGFAGVFAILLGSAALVLGAVVAALVSARRKEPLGLWMLILSVALPYAAIQSRAF